MAATTLKLQATVNGQTVTLAEIATANATAGLVPGDVATSIAIPLTRPVKIDSGTAINMVSVQNASQTIATATVHLMTEAIDGV